MRGSACEIRYAILILGLVIGVEVEAAGDSARGAQVFRACAACHSVKPGEHMTGPSLANIWQRKAGSVEGFLRYSDAMHHAKLVWSESTLDQWLANPDRLIPGTSMTFAGLREVRDRQDVIAYLKAVSTGKSPPANRRGGMQAGRPNLKEAPPQDQVTAISRCGDTYTVRTADGKVNKVWEFNLRLKTDSSEAGPFPGKPVIVGAGMQGDRASVVFAAPDEISSFIKQACR